MNVRYIKPVFYDDTITIKTSLKEAPKSRIKFYHEAFNQNNEKINEAEITLVFVDQNTRKPMRAPEIVLEKLESYNKI